ncbi:MAG: 50S ribosomal protein L28 [Deltaproteobacteria bacterium]|nr:50S ribosomal protein L28 [Deltaproteobacteria bacterium]MBU51355.1 50S ribosomal protein L28 [Deltaproteobacteria bacterium]
MSRRCEICGKGRLVLMKVSHSHKRSKKVCKANIQKVRAVVNGRPQRLRACTTCIKTGRVTKP